MAKKLELEIMIGEMGAVTVHVNGVKGSKCMDLTKDIEEALGVVVSRDKTGEFYQVEQSEVGKLNLN